MIGAAGCKKAMLVVALAFVSMLAFGETQVVNGITWTYVVSGGKASVGGGRSGSYIMCAVPDSTEGEISIPSTLGGYPVKSVSDYAFFGREKLKSVKIPSSVTSIGRYAFQKCRGLTLVTIPSSVTSIEYGAFAMCSGLKSLTIPSSVKSIGGGAFSCCGLTSVTIPASIKSLENEMFYGCLELTKVTIQSGVTSIGKDAFYNCSGLTSLTIPSSVTSIGSGAFSGCSGLKSLTIPSGVTSISDSLFKGCSGLTELTIPSSVTSFGVSAFYGCIGLRSLKIPSSMTRVGDSTFRGCSGLTSVTIPSSVTSIGDYAFAGCSGLVEVEIPSSVTSIGRYAFEDCSGLNSVSIPSGVTSIGDKTFAGCAGLTSLTLPSSVTRFGWCAFAGCSGLTSLSIPSTVTSVGDSAFSGCNGLKMLEIAEGVKSIECSAFSNCSGLTSLTIPSSVESVGDRAFQGCSGLKSVIISEGVMHIGMHAFDGCSGLTSLMIPSSVTFIRYFAFMNCTGLTTVTISLGLTSIEESLFEGCGRLTSVTIPPSVTRIGNHAFDGCSGLRSVEIPLGVTSIGTSAFEGCSGLKSLTIPSSMESIGNNAFMEMGTDVEFVFEGAPPYTPYPLAGAEVAGYRGYYRHEYADEWESVLDENGKWMGIAMKEMEEPDPSLTINAYEMDWGRGEITLRYQRADGKSLSADGRTFEVYWSDVTNGVDQTRRVSHFPNSGIVRDSDFLMRGDGIHPVYYTVVASDGTKACCKTRDRYGVFVGVTDYGDSYLDRTPSPEMGKDADFVSSMFRADAGLSDSNMWVLKGAKATRGDISDCMKLISERAGVGDAVMVYFSCHGGYDENDTDYALCLYDGYYPSTDFSEDIKKVDGNGDSGIGIVCVMDACYSQSAYDREKISGNEMDWYIEKGLTVCSKNVSYVAASLTDETAEYKFGLTKFMIGYGWREGYAKGRSTIGEYRSDLMKLSQYAKQHIELIGRQHVDYVNENLLRNFVIHIPANSPVTERPSEPIGLRASQGSSDKGIYVSFSPSEDADFYVVYNQKDGKRHVVATTTNTWCVPRDADGKILQSGRFFVAAVNGFGVSALGGPVSGWVRSCDEKPVETVFPDIEGDPVATVTGDVEMGFVVKPSEVNTAVEVTIPQGVDAAQVTVEVSTKVASVKPNGAMVKIVNGGGDITEYLDIPGTAKGDDGGVVATQETIDLTKATVKEEIVKEAMDVEKGAVIDLSGGSLGTTSPTITTAPTHVGLFYTFSEGRTLGGMERSDSKVGDGQPWSPEIKVKGGSSAFYSIGVDKGE